MGVSSMFKVASFGQEFNCRFTLDTPREISGGYVEQILACLYFPDTERDEFYLRVDLLGRTKTSTGKLDKRSGCVDLKSSRDEDYKLVIEAVDATLSGFSASADSFRKLREVAQSDLAAFVARTGG
jgi:hypothetical protein